ncbi:glucose sorbosone dehydrogenase [Haloterrigena turkmenica DSM 5511]|uniref:Glucose sorbosone dehydrogenase n=1 Tax=Haloterrigena turkmenica (strain ATCC 51198 / DSM 5511 / JCM 9101 / NCIMB 13204 / VKM B-1734 / 4k) TaxID=543526 RepID=D2RUL2_HALTV|nr:PQQ-dependent sugar dehydrogenase [Haloterrigena turkmenica]ADB61184.1 glucose sorbosone dehydrogenase [Haloterrigena turkmenica DSM 5511]
MCSPTRRRLLAATGAAVPALAGCFTESGSDATELATPESVPADDWVKPDWRPADAVPSEDDVAATTVVSDLAIPWDLTVAAGDAFVTERDGGVRRFDADTLAEDADLGPNDGETLLESASLPDRASPGEGGTLGVAAHPDYPDTPDLFVYYTADDGGVSNRVVRYDLEADALETILEGIPGSSVHNGGRIAFGPDDHLWVLTGDAREPALSQDPGSRAGAVLRVTPDGEPHPENPDWGDDGDRRTYTLGHRNPQGLDFTPQGTPILAEHGPGARDELSILRPGGNYGWDIVRGGPDDPEYGSYDEYEAATPPVVNTGPKTTWAPSGLAFYDDDAIGPWENTVLVCGLTSSALSVVGLTPRSDSDGDDEASSDDTDGVRYDADWLDDRVTATVHRLFADEWGRLRHVEPGPDGSLYLLTSNRDGRADGPFPRTNDDRIVRLDPR